MTTATPEQIHTAVTDHYAEAARRAGGRRRLGGPVDGGNRLRSRRPRVKKIGFTRTADARIRRLGDHYRCRPFLAGRR